MTFGPGRAAGELSYQLQGVASRREYLTTTAAMLLTLLGEETVVTSTWLDADAGRADVVVFPMCVSDTQRAAQLLHVADDHPTVQSYLRDFACRTSVEPRRVSDLVTHAELRRTKAYAEHLRPAGAEYQISILTGRVNATGMRGWVLNRSRSDFSDAERDLAVALQPMLWLLESAVGDNRLHELTTQPQRTAEPSPMTLRELEVLRLVGNGLTAAAIGRLLRISDRTVRKHLENAYRKLGCSDRLLAVQRAQQLELIPTRGQSAVAHAPNSVQQRPAPTPVLRETAYLP